MRALRLGLLVTIAAGVCTVGIASPAHAEEPVAASEPRLMSETAEITSVVDAFDKDDPFDMHLLLGFTQMWKSANIRRETSLFQPGLTTGGFVARTENIAKFSQTTSTLNVGADIGIFKDFALVLRLPIILSDARSLGDLDGSSSTANRGRTQDPMGAQLFKVPFTSPTRSGVDWFSAGLDWAIYNQQRDYTKPTWVVGVEGRFAIGPSMHACNASPDTGPQCPDPVNPAVNRDPGISRGMNAIGAHTIFSKRYGYVEPYTGFNFLAEFAQDRGDFGATNNLNGALVNHPPLLGTFTLGLEVIPYEHREQFQRLIADFRVSGTYHSPGREYSELFDALGSSQAPSLRQPNPTGYMHNPSFDPKNPLAQPVSIVDPQAQKAYFTGITDQQAFGSISAHAAATWQAGEYIKFQAGLGFTFNQSHLVTSADACNPNFADNIDKSGPCHTAGAVSGTATGIPNPNHRAVIDLPGRRFSVDDTMIVNLWVSGVVMF